MDTFNNKYRIPSARLQTWDYGANGAYFITICTHNRVRYFGEIADGKMKLNELGVLAEKYWMEIPVHFPFIELGNFVVMPNHTHGILIIDKNGALDGGMDGAMGGAMGVETLHCNVSTANATPIQMAKISPKPGTISTIIRSYKSVVSKNARLIHADFAWQPRFHDHIIRHSRSFDNIQNYIAVNPMNWGKDKFHKNNV